MPGNTKFDTAFNRITLHTFKVRLLLCLTLSIAAICTIHAETNNPDTSEIQTPTELRLDVTNEPAVKLTIRQSFIFPFLQGESPLTEGNNLAAVFSAEVTPVSLNGIGEVIWTPAAFFLLSGGGRAGSGWNMPLGNGIGINRPVTEPDNPETPYRKSEIAGTAFDGLLWAAWGAGTVQFDLGAVIPGDWNHVLFQTRQEFRYAAYTKALGGEPWVFQNDFRENQNGWNYQAGYVIGYYMPASPVLDTIAFMVELYKSLYNTEEGGFWGEDLGYWIFSGLFNFSISPRFSTALALQMHTRRNHGNRNFNLDTDYFYRDLPLESEGGKRRLLFYRAALILNYKLR